MDIGQSATLTTTGADTFEADISEHREDDEGRQELAGVMRNLVNERIEEEPESKPRVVMYHHVVFTGTVDGVL